MEEVEAHFTVSGELPKEMCRAKIVRVSCGRLGVPFPFPTDSKFSDSPTFSQLHFEDAESLWKRFPFLF